MIRYAYDRTGLPVPLLVAGAILVLLVAAWLVHRLVERPLGPALRRLIATGPVRFAAGVSMVDGPGRSVLALVPGTTSRDMTIGRESGKGVTLGGRNRLRV
jgi:peptidoglycan/LPS O-acetylase OafA/YrhL